MTREQVATLKQRSLCVAYIGTEPVRSAILARFVEWFEPVGFDRTAFRPCYGLAGATRMSAGGDPIAQAQAESPALMVGPTSARPSIAPPTLLPATTLPRRA